MIIFQDTIKRAVALALLTAAATALGTKAVEYLFEKLKDDKKPDDGKKLIIP